MGKVIHVAVGVILGEDDTILIAKRPQHLDQGGKWEFPGGKVEPQESIKQALFRELKEELGINVIESKALMKISFDYPEKTVLLDIHTVMDFSGTPAGLEGQSILWVRRDQLGKFDFPAANLAIVEKLLIQTPKVT